ncbi:Dimethyladenosine transferase 1, mitochondrial [Araneus ventricosus]|uniref:rRNA adenine N(6)-methyltransferase n=1 Tax=Araneus ventricosus TaxID=182803 RepID=A0A4Y2QRV1_ARAVE|nr:Dimethyladenosine transferase 1, mitochondrial [Araneus ventricosus]
MCPDESIALRDMKFGTQDSIRNRTFCSKMVRLSIFRLAETLLKEVAAASTPAVDSALQRLPPLPSPRDLLKLYKIRAQRHLSQNFLLDFRLNNKIVTKTGNIQNCYVCEVGPGPGNITRSILQNGAKHVIVIEKDRRFLPSLELLADASGGRMKIILADIMDIDLENILPRTLACEWKMLPPPLFIIGNLPFNISTPLIIKWLRHCSKHTGPFIHGRTRLTLTFQKEVALRMIADADSESRSRLSIMCQYLCNVKHLFNIPGTAFFPKPEVDVAVVKFTPRIRPLIDQPFELVEKVVSTIFHHRQKFCRYGIVNLFPPNRPQLVEEMINKSKVNPEKRSFNLEMEEFRALCNAYNDICQNNKGIFEYNYLIHKKKYSMFDEEDEHDSPQTDVNVESGLEDHKM